jgi:ABC-type polysaccharide transport system permease subunit
MAILRKKHKHEGTVSTFAVFFSLIFFAIGIILGSVRENLGAFRPVAGKVKIAPRFLSRAIVEKIAYNFLQNPESQ